MQQLLDAAHHQNSSEYLSDDPDARYFDVIGFDPRGVNNTTPFHTCFSDPGEQVAWGLRDTGVLGSPEINFEFLYAKHEALAAGCAEQSKISNFMSTAMVARDMVEIIERHGQWRQKHVDSLTWADAAAKDRVRWLKGEEPLLYYGYSYGTLLGTTFAAMQPHRVKRVLLDSVVDVDSYYRGLWTGNLADTDKVMGRFFEYCAAAGPDRCAFADGGPAASLQSRWDNLEKDVALNGPIVVPGVRGSHGPDVITLSDVKQILRTSLYFPLSNWELFANLTAPLLQWNGTLLADHKRKQSPIFANLQRNQLNLEINPYDPDSLVYEWAESWTRFEAIACGDGHIKHNRTTFSNLWDYYQRESRYSGDSWATLLMACVGWPGLPRWRFADKHPVASNATAHPILFANNLLDNVTPMMNARKMQRLFRGSGLLEVDGEGHCVTNSPSLCAGRALRAYFQTGALPELKEPCLPQRRPFLGTSGPRTEALPEHMSSGERSIVDALEMLLP